MRLALSMIPQMTLNVTDEMSQELIQEPKLELIQDIDKDAIEEISRKYPEILVSNKGHLHIPVNIITKVMLTLKNEYGYNYLTNVTAVDYLDHFNVIYNVVKVGKPNMLHIIVKIDRSKPEIPSMVPIFGGAVWQEREVYDLLGIIFTGHPDLRRILLDESWEDHPLRRDFKWDSGRS